MSTEREKGLPLEAGALLVVMAGSAGYGRGLTRADMGQHPPTCPVAHAESNGQRIAGWPLTGRFELGHAGGHLLHGRTAAPPVRHASLGPHSTPATGHVRWPVV